MSSDTPDSTVAAFSPSEKTNRGTPSILDNVRNRTIETLAALIGTLFEQIDDTFFELADSAHNNNEQNVYFESMREIRLQRKRVEQLFFTSIEHDFRELTQTSKALTPEEPLESLQLLDHEAVEIDVAISTMVSRARCEFPTVSLQINTRLSSFLKPKTISEDNNPIDPQQIVRHFVRACDQFHLTLQSRLIFFKQFDRLVLRHYEQVLLDANQILVAAGILPNLRAIIRRTPIRENTNTKPNSPAGPQRQRHSPLQTQLQTQKHSQQQTSVSHNAFATLQTLLAATQNLQEPSVYIDSKLPTANHQELFNILDDLQSGGALDLHQQTQQTSVAFLNIRQNLVELLHQHEHSQRNIGRVDSDIINIVDMIFEYILTQNLPAAMTLLIGRLQIPVLKTAIKDSAFFSTNKHPARRLLNLINHACLGWDHNTTTETDKLYQQVEQVVGELLDSTHCDLSSFEHAELSLLAFTKKAESRAKTMEQRTIAAEEGKAKTEQAKQLITQLVRDRIQGKELPSVVIEFLKNPWQRLLLQALLKEGKASYAWRSTLQIADDLIWSVQPQKNDASHKRWLKMIPVLLGDIKTGLGAIAYKPSDTDKMMSHLWKIHSQMLTYKGNSNPLRTQKVDLADQQPPQIANPTAIARATAIGPVAMEKSLVIVARFKTGSWFTFIDGDNKPLRCKLTTKIRATESYIFVNRFGVKSLHLTCNELAVALHDKKLIQLDSGPIVDRALESIMNRLKSSLP